MMHKLLLPKFFTLMLGIGLLYCTGCIGDDIIDDRVPEKIRITSFVDTMAVGESFLFEAKYFNEIGNEEAYDFQWYSSDESVIMIGDNGQANALSLGNALITVEAVSKNGEVLTDIQSVEVTQLGDMGGDPGQRIGTINTTSTYLLEGDFTLTETEDGLLLTLEDNFTATSALPGLYVYLGNNNATIASALEIGKVTQFEGKHSYTISDAGINEYGFLLFWCKPFNVKVGEGIFNN